MLQRAETFLATGKYNRAETDLNQVIRLNADSAAAHYVLAKLHQARGENRVYTQELMAALQLDNNRLPIRIEAAQSLIAGGDAKGGLSLLDLAPQSQKQMLPWVVQRNWTLWSVGDLTEMRKGIDAGLSMKRDGELLLQDGLWKLRAGKFAAARESLEQALDINPGDVRALGALNEAYIAQKQGPLALQKVKEYASHNPKAAPVQEFLGVLLSANGDRQGARKAFEAARAADPDLCQGPTLLNSTGYCRWQIGRCTAASKAYSDSRPGECHRQIVVCEPRGDEGRPEGGPGRFPAGDPS